MRTIATICRALWFTQSQPFASHELPIYLCFSYGVCAFNFLPFGFLCTHTHTNREAKISRLPRYLPTQFDHISVRYIELLLFFCSILVLFFSFLTHQMGFSVRIFRLHMCTRCRVLDFFSCFSLFACNFCYAFHTIFRTEWMNEWMCVCNMLEVLVGRVIATTVGASPAVDVYTFLYKSVEKLFFLSFCLQKIKPSRLYYVLDGAIEKLYAFFPASWADVAGAAFFLCVCMLMKILFVSYSLTFISLARHIKMCSLHSTESNAYNLELLFSSS